MKYIHRGWTVMITLFCSHVITWKCSTHWSFSWNRCYQINWVTLSECRDLPSSNNTDADYWKMRRGEGDCFCVAFSGRGWMNTNVWVSVFSVDVVVVNEWKLKPLVSSWGCRGRYGITYKGSQKLWYFKRYPVSDNPILITVIWFHEIVSHNKHKILVKVGC